MRSNRTQLTSSGGDLVGGCDSILRGAARTLLGRCCVAFNSIWWEGGVNVLVASSSHSVFRLTFVCCCIFLMNTLIPYTN